MMKNMIMKNFYKTLMIPSTLFILILNPNMFFDKISYLLTNLTIIFYLISLLSMKFISLYYKNMKLTNHIFFSMLFILTISFCLSNMFLFYILFEMSVIPIFSYIMSWGSSKSKIAASYYLFFFTFFSSLLFLLSLFFMYNLYGSFNFFIMSSMNMIIKSKIFFYMMTLMFLVKMPVFLFHIWLPLAHVESPMLGSMILASIMLKLGSYGMFRLMEIFTINFFSSKMLFISWGVWGSIITGMLCISQIDLKKMVAFSSVSHMTMILVSLFSMKMSGLKGSMFMMLSHGITSSLMFLGLGILYYRINSRNIFSLNGSISMSPMFSFWWFLIIILNLGFPPILSFFSEFFIFISMVISKNEFFILGMILIMISSIYSINMLMYIMSGLKKSKFLFYELNILEHMLMLIHLFFMIMSISFMWMM